MKDIFSNDDYICRARINLKDIIDVPKLLEIPVKLPEIFMKI